MNETSRLKEPQPEEYVASMHHHYNGRDFYGPHAQELAEVHYLRDWKRWAEEQLQQLQGNVTIVTNVSGECVAVTRTDKEYRILSVIWGKPDTNTSDCPFGA